MLTVTRIRHEAEHDVSTITWFWRLRLDILMTVIAMRVAHSLVLTTVTSFWRIESVVLKTNRRIRHEVRHELHTATMFGASDLQI